ncbi:MAG: 3-hydroxyacyl-CoA dehydrogenase family protein, partial [Firmicutes bacterium]|nr:3-hydroxyacyl-CoA dehydrogenase family protein [Bacillota bacterium]
IDTFRNISDYLFADLDNNQDGSPLFRSLVEQGRLGVKSAPVFMTTVKEKPIRPSKNAMKNI